MASAKKVKEKAGVVAYRLTGGAEPRVLLVTARKFPNTWVLPVGSVEKGETFEAAARRECLEESGFRVAIGRQLSALDVADGKKTTRFHFFLAAVVGQATHWEKDRQRKWIPASELTDALPDVFRDVAREATKRLLEMDSEHTRA